MLIIMQIEVLEFRDFIKKHTFLYKVELNVDMRRRFTSVFVSFSKQKNEMKSLLSNVIHEFHSIPHKNRFRILKIEKSHT